MLHDETTDIFGWPYLVMPRMPGTCSNERSILTMLGDAARRDVAVALANGLVELQRLSWRFAGDFDPTVTLAPYPLGDTQHIVDETTRFAASARANGAFARDDDLWVDAAAQRALSNAPEHRYVYVHGDYKLNNLTVMPADTGWRVSGVFDLHESRFGDGAVDLVRQTCSYLDTDAPLAAVFAQAYLRMAKHDANVAARMPLYVINDRIKIWEYFTRPDARADWPKRTTFRPWAERYVDGICAVV